MMSNEPTPLERLMELAASDVGIRPAFYRKLLDSNVLVPVLAPSYKNGKVPAGEMILIKCLNRIDGVQVIPFFSSPKALYEAVPGGDRCVVMSVRELFESKPDSHFHLNPASAVGREFIPIEVDLLLRTGGLSEVTLGQVPSDERVALSVPEGDHARFIEALRTLFARHLEVNSACLVEMTRSAPHGKSLLVAVDSTSESGDVTYAIATVVQETCAEVSVPVDVIRIDTATDEFGRELLDGFMPFYRIGLAASLARNQTFTLNARD